MPSQITTTSASPWTAKTLAPSWPAPDATLTLGKGLPQTQSWRGFGGCFNELGWDALLSLAPAQRAPILESLFGADGCRFTHCRLPIGASDYALEWYSHNEHLDDLAMSHFSIARDEKFLIPYIKAAQAIQLDIEFLALPWSIIPFPAHFASTSILPAPLAPNFRPIPSALSGFSHFPVIPKKRSHR